MFRYRFYTLSPQGREDEAQESLETIEEMYEEDEE
jgi:hypothetical protein